MHKAEITTEIYDKQYQKFLYKCLKFGYISLKVAEVKEHDALDKAYDAKN